MTRLQAALKRGSGREFPLPADMSDGGRKAHVLDSQPEPEARELQREHAFPMSVLSVPCGDVFPAGTKDFFVLCGCGWCSRVLVTMPTVVRCESCDAKRQGRSSFEEFAISAARRGCSTVLDIDGE